MSNLNGWKTYITAIVGICLGIYLLSTGDYQGGIEAILAALGWPIPERYLPPNLEAEPRRVV